MIAIRLLGRLSLTEVHRPLTAWTAVGELLAIFSAIRVAASISASGRWSSLTMPSRCASCAEVSLKQRWDATPRLYDP